MNTAKPKHPKTIFKHPKQPVPSPGRNAHAKQTAATRALPAAVARQELRARGHQELAQAPGPGRGRVQERCALQTCARRAASSLNARACGAVACLEWCL